MQPSEIDQELRAAIAQRSLVMFEYADLVRVVEPHRYGVNSAGNAMLSGWLRAGYSRSDPAGGWRNYLLSDIHALQRLDAPFIGPRAGYNPHDPRMREVFAELPVLANEAAPAETGPYIVRDLAPAPMTADAAPRDASAPNAVSPPEAARTQDGEIDPPESHV